MSNTKRGLAIAGVTAAFGLTGTSLGNLFGGPLVWSATMGVIGATVGVAMFRTR
jgi:hypothetical protein